MFATHQNLKNLFQFKSSTFFPTRVVQFCVPSRDSDLDINFELVTTKMIRKCDTLELLPITNSQNSACVTQILRHPTFKSFNSQKGFGKRNWMGNIKVSFFVCENFSFGTPTTKAFCLERKGLQKMTDSILY